ncbi:MAG: DoxX family membrane protein [Saprospiraceae bacterium]|nr:DoxX family membrane protein [Saprospiraceae bacterium]
MLKTILIALLAVFFILNGINHLVNSRVLAEYAHQRNLGSPKLMVLISGIGLIIGGVMLCFYPTRQLGSIGLAAFVVIAAGLIHHFWTEREREKRLMEGQNFVKNLAIAIEMIYIAFG